MGNKVLPRLLTFFIVFPILIALMFLDFGGHLVLFILTVAASIVGAIEMAVLLRSKEMQTNIYLPVVFGLAFPVLAYAENLGWIQSHHTMAIASLVIMFVFIRQIFVNTETAFQAILGKVAGNLLTLIYPGFFLYFIIKIFNFPQASLLLLIFALATFGNDALAWLVGNIFGKHSRKPFLVSPNKSLAGFIGGIAGTFIALLSSFWFWPGLLGHNLYMVLGLALILALTTIVGDLFESSLKRSAGVKDSGTLIPGRGGILDSIDSLLFSAPVFYIFLMYGRF
jgi:phosphatidate cytidylyltransferase